MQFSSFADFRAASTAVTVAGLITCVGLIGVPSVAVGQDELSEEASQAEYVRLAREVQRFAERNAWSGVERSYQSILANGTAAA
ncbi:MAG: hypothetical protein ACJARS_004392, partial [bacterium]